MTTELGDIVEVVKTNTNGANILLDAGYRLLDVQTATEGILNRYGRIKANNNFWVERYTEYVLGRPRDVAHVEPPRRHHAGRIKNVPVEIEEREEVQA